MFERKKKDFTFSTFRIHEIKGYIECIQIIEYEQGMLLIDSGCINDVKRIENFCQNVLNRPPSDIKLIALTHLHPDHSGGAVKLRSKYGIPIAAHADIDRWYASWGGVLQQTIDCYLATTVARRNQRRLERIFYRRRIEPDYLLHDEDVLPIFSDWQVLNVPGHTLHDLAFFHKKEQILCIADLICDVKGKPQLPIPILFPDKMAESFKRLASIGARIVFRSHGNPILTDNSYELFLLMQKLLNSPRSPIAKRIYRISTYSPEARKEIRKLEG